MPTVNAMSAGIQFGNVKLAAVFQVSIDLANTPTITTAETTVTVKGLRVNDFVFANKPSHSTGLGIANCRVSADDTLVITTVNPTAGGINPSAETYTLVVIRPESLSTVMQE